MSYYIIFVESTYGEVKSIYRKKSIDNTYHMYLTLSDAVRFLSKEELHETFYEIIVSKDEIDSYKDIKKGSFLTVKSAGGKIIEILRGKHLPKDNTVEVVYIERKIRIRRK